MPHRQVLRRFFRGGSWLALAGLLAACSATLSSEDPEPGDDTADDDQGTAGSGGKGGTAGQGLGGKGGSGGGPGGSGGMGGSGGSTAPDGGSPADAANKADTGNTVSADAGVTALDTAATTADAAVSFMDVYLKECAACHGLDGAGTTRAPDIIHPVRDFSTWVVRNGRTNPNFKDPMAKYTTDQISVATLNQIFDFLAAPAKATQGMALYKDFCANCHGADAKGGVTVRNISTKTATEFISNVRGGHSLGQFTIRHDYMPKWSMTQLSDAEIRLISAYVDTL